MLARLLLTLLLLVGAGAAEAKSLVVRYPVNNPANNDNAYAQQYQDFAGLASQAGVTYRPVNATATRTLFLKTGIQTWGFNGTTGTGAEAFDCVFIIGYDKQVTPPAGLNVDSLTLPAGWASVPVVFIVAPTTLAGRLQQADACSTMSTSIASAFAARLESYSIVGGSLPYKWNAWKEVPYPSIAESNLKGRIMRPLLTLQYSGATPRGNYVCADCDSTGPTTTPPNADTLLAYVLARSTVEPAPILVIDPGAGENGNVPMLADAIQWADSVTNGKVRDAPGAKPIKIAVVVHHAVGRGDHRYNGQNSYPGSGGVSVSTVNDSANVKGSLDSLNTLGVPITFLADPCSLAAYPSSKDWIYKVATARVGLEVNAGTYVPGGGANSGNATVTYPVDPFGRVRSRLILPAGATGLPTDCSSDTTSTFCSLVNNFAILRQYFGARVDPSVYPGGGDWSPTTHTRNSQGPGVDSVLWSASKANVKTLLIEPITTSANVGISWDILNGFAWGGATGPAAAPKGYFPDAYNWPIFGAPRASSSNGPSKGGGVTGHLKIVATRGVADGATTMWVGQTHDIRGEFWHGLASSNWYFAPLPYYYHSFYTRTPVFSINMSQLGGDGSANPSRYGFWQTKWLVRSAQFANSLGLPGKPMFQFVYLSEVDP